MDLAFLIFLTANLHWEIWLSIHCNKTTFFCTLTILTILVTDLKVNSGGYLLYCFAAWWISTSFTDTDRSEWICYYISDRYQKISLFLSIYQKNWSEIKLLTCDFVSLAAWKWIELGIHFGTSQSAHAKSTIYLFGMY